jgi:hypothetical protein
LIDFFVNDFFFFFFFLLLKCICCLSIYCQTVCFFFDYYLLYKLYIFQIFVCAFMQLRCNEKKVIRNIYLKKSRKFL